MSARPLHPLMQQPQDFHLAVSFAVHADKGNTGNNQLLRSLDRAVPSQLRKRIKRLHCVFDLCGDAARRFRILPLNERKLRP